MGLGVGGLLLVALILGGGYYLLRRGQPAPGPGVAEAPPAPQSSPLSGAAAGGSQPDEAAPSPLATPPPVSAEPAARATPPFGAGSVPGPARPATAAAAAPTTTAAAPPQPEPAGAEFSHLDELPGEEADGRATGEALAQKYRSGGGGSSSTTRFRQRPKVPRGVTQPERPAVATLLYVNSVEEAFHRKNGRYGTLRELADAGLFALDVPFDANGFKRARYAFRVTVEADGYRADALPQAPIGRPFLVDDSGIVRLEE